MYTFQVCLWLRKEMCKQWFANPHSGQALCQVLKHWKFRNGGNVGIERAVGSPRGRNDLTAPFRTKALHFWHKCQRLMHDCWMKISLHRTKAFAFFFFMREVFLISEFGLFFPWSASVCGRLSSFLFLFSPLLFFFSPNEAKKCQKRMIFHWLYKIWPSPNNIIPHIWGIGNLK